MHSDDIIFNLQKIKEMSLKLNAKNNVLNATQQLL